MGNELIYAIKMFGALEKDYPNWDKCDYFTRAELRKYFILECRKGDTYFRTIIEILQGFNVLGNVSDSHYPFNLDAYYKFKKQFKGRK